MKIYIPKTVSAGWKMKSNISPLPLHTFKKCFTVLEKGADKKFDFNFPLAQDWRIEGLDERENMGKHFLQLVITERCSFYI